MFRPSFTRRAVPIQLYRFTAVIGKHAPLRPVSKRYATYPANLCPLSFGGEFAKFGSDFGEAVGQAID
jgi:hypothetical protein